VRMLARLGQQIGLVAKAFRNCAPRLANLNTALHCTALHCTALHCTALHCTSISQEPVSCLERLRPAQLRVLREGVDGQSQPARGDA
jgi:hypothetical protein